MTAVHGSMEVMPKTSARLLSLLSLLQARRDWPGPLLAERLGISPRTLRRDVDRLRELGYPVVAAKGPDGGYRLDAGTRMPPLHFDDEQAVALAVALSAAGATGAGIEDAAARALATVRQVMPARLRHRIDALDVTAVGPSAAGTRDEADGDVLMALGAAVRAHEELRFDHVPSGPPGTGGAPSRPRGGCSPTISSPGAGAGTWSPGISTATTGGSSAPTASRPACPPVPGSPLGTCPARMSPPS